MTVKSIRDKEDFDFEKIVYCKLLEKAGRSFFMPYRGHDGIYYFLGFYFRLNREQSRKLLLSMNRRGLLKIGNRGVKILR